MISNSDVANRFNETADLLELQGANAFRVRAYRNAVKTIEELSRPVSEMVADPAHSLTDLPGIGKDIAAKITELTQTGTFALLEELRAEFPSSLRDFLRIPGLGPKKAAILIRTLGIRTIDDLRATAETGQIAKIKGFGAKSEQAILSGLSELEKIGHRFLISEATITANEIEMDLRSLESVSQISVAGSCRRRKETCGDLDLLAVASDSKEVMDRLASHPLVQHVIQRGDTKQRVRLTNGMELDLRVVPEESYGAALQYFTGSKEHNVVIRRMAQERGLKLNEYGLFREEERVAGQTEEEIYQALGLTWIPPELREDRGEIELAAAGTLPELVKISDIRGDLHMHTTATDGTASIREMIEAARQRGLEYIAITDHSKRVSMANGLNAHRLREHWEEIKAIRAEYTDIHVLCGVECDILENAELDLPNDVLEEADWVLAVLHYGLKQPREQIMQRLLTAIRNPHVSAIGHPSGRLIGRRLAADIDYPMFLKAAADFGVMLEINSNPARLDLDEYQTAAARDLNIPIVINTDAHTTSGLDDIEFGVDQARRAGLTAKDVANTRPVEELLQMVRSK